jgi:carboxyl-terminal processing protease
LAVGPIATALVCASLLVGFTSSRDAADRIAPQRASSPDPVAVTQERDQSDTSSGSLEQDDSDLDPVDEYRTALALLKDNYYGSAIDERRQRALTYEAIRGMLNSLQDPFSSFLDPSEWQQFQANVTRGDFEGIGALLQEGRPYTRIEEPIEGGPADKAGIRAGDEILRVGNVSTAGRTVDDVIGMVKGPSGTRVAVMFARGKRTFSIILTRARVELPIVKYWMEDPRARIGHIVLQEFNEKSLDQLNRAFASLEQQGMKALVFDLRGNPGGLLDVAVQLASIFIPRNSVAALKNNAVIIREGSGREQGRPLEMVDSTYTRRVPLVLLVNDNSASASEIVAGAIRDYGAGLLIGDRTYGKGCVQTLFPLDDGSCLRLTTALYYPPRHYDINYKQDEDHNRIPNTGGLLPDLMVPQAPDWKAGEFLTDKDAIHDTQLQAALAFLRDRLNGMPVSTAEHLVEVQFKNANARLAEAPTPSDLK